MYRPPHLPEIASPSEHAATERCWHPSCAACIRRPSMRVPSSLFCSVGLIAAVLVGCGSEVSVAQTVDRTDPPANAEGTAFETTPTGPVVEAPSTPTSATA